jgi:hypothetical protein
MLMDNATDIPSLQTAISIRLYDGLNTAFVILIKYKCVDLKPWSSEADLQTIWSKMNVAAIPIITRELKMFMTTTEIEEFSKNIVDRIVEKAKQNKAEAVEGMFLPAIQKILADSIDSTFFEPILVLLKKYYSSYEDYIMKLLKKSVEMNIQLKETILTDSVFLKLHSKLEFRDFFLQADFTKFKNNSIVKHVYPREILQDLLKKTLKDQNSYPAALNYCRILRELYDDPVAFAYYIPLQHAIAHKKSFEYPEVDKNYVELIDDESIFFNNTVSNVFKKYMEK